MASHEEHIRGGYFVLSCPKCRDFIQKYERSGRRWRGKTSTGWFGESKRHRDAAVKAQRRRRDSDGDGVPDYKDCRPFDPRRQDEALWGHTSPESAYVVGDYPYGFRLRTKMRVWVERNKHGERFVSQTLNPKTGVWNKPKAGTYSVLVLLFMGNDGHVGWKSVGWNTTEEQLDRVLDNWGVHLTDAQKKDVQLIRAYQRGQRHYTWTVRSGNDTTPAQTREEQAEIVNKATLYELSQLRREERK